MHSKLNRILATIYAVGLGIGETVMNWGDWQYAPLWIVDYVIVAALLIGATQSTNLKSAQILKAAWALSFGVMYMALFVSLAPELRSQAEPPPVMIGLIGLLMAISVTGLVLSFWAERSIEK